MISHPFSKLPFRLLAVVVASSRKSDGMAVANRRHDLSPITPHP